MGQRCLSFVLLITFWTILTFVELQKAQIENSLEQIETYLLKKNKEYERLFEEALNKSRGRRNVTKENILDMQQLKYTIIQTKKSNFSTDFKILCLLKVDNSSLAFGTDKGNLIFYNNNVVTSYKKLPGIPYHMEHFLYNGIDHFVVGYKTNYKNRYFIQVFVRDDDKNYSRITFDYKTDFQVVKLKSDYYMFTCSIGSERLAELYKLTPHFNFLTDYPTKNSVACTLWLMEGSLYAVIAQETGKSPLLIYNENTKELALLQMISVERPSKVARFAINKYHYLIFLANGTPTIHYWWEGDQFLEQQQLKVNAFDLDVGQLKTGKILIGIATKKTVMFFVEYVKGKFRPAGNFSVDSTIENIKIINIAKDYILVNFEEKSSEIYELIIEQSLEPYDKKNETSLKPLFQCLVSLNETLTERSKSIHNMLINASKVWTTNRHHKRIEAHVIIKNDLIVDKAVFITEVNMEIDYDILRNGYHKSLQDYLALFGDLQAKARRAVTKSTYQEITGNIKFQYPIESEDTRINYLSNDIIINNMSLKALEKYALKTKQITKESFKINFIKAQEIIVEGKLNGIFIKDLFLINGMQTITGNLSFTDLHINEDLNVKRTINDISFDEIVSRENFVIYGKKVFNRILVKKNIEVRTNTNKLKLSSVARKVVTTTSDHRLSGNISFKDHVIIHNLILTGSVNEKKFEKLYSEAVLIDRYHHKAIKGLKTFNNNVTVDNMKVYGQFNNRNLESLLTTHTKQLITNIVTFKNLIIFENDLTVDTINSIRFSDAVLSFRNEIITSRKIFESNIIVNDIELGEHGTINGIKPSDLLQLYQLITETRYTEIAVNSTNYIKSSEDIRNINISNMWRKSKNKTICVPVNFGNTVVFENSLRADMFLKNKLISYSTNIINANITFVDDVTTPLINHICGKVNGINLYQLKKEIFLISNPWKCKGTKTFHSLSVKNGITTKLLNGYDTSDIVLLHTDQYIIGNIVFKNVLVHNLRVRNLFVANINEYSVETFLSEIVTQNSQNVTLTDKVFNNIIVKGSITVKGMIDGVAIEEFIRRAVTQNSKQNIVQKIFTNDLIFEDDLSVHSLNNLDIVDHINRVVFVDQKEIYGQKIVEGNVEVKGELIIEGLINGVNIELLSQKALSKNKSNTFNSFTFYKDVIIDKLYTKTLNGKDVNNLITIYGNETLNYVLITNDITAYNIKIKGLLNNNNITKFKESALYKYKHNQTIIKMKKIKNLIVEGNTNFQGKVNDEDPSAVFKSPVKLTVLNYTRIHVKNMYVRTINNVDLSFLKDIVLKSEEQLIKGVTIFANVSEMIIEKDLEIRKNLSVNSINDLIMSNVVTKHSVQTIYGNIKLENLIVDNLYVTESINGLSIPKDLVLKNTDEVVYGTTYFNEFIQMNKNLNVYGMIEDVNASLIWNALHTKEYRWNFLDEVFVDKLIIRESINGINVEEFVSSSTEVITGVKIIKSLTTDVLNTTFINGYNLTNIITSIYENNNPKTIMEIKNKVTVEKITVRNTFNDNPIHKIGNYTIVTLDNLTTNLVNYNSYVEKYSTLYSRISEFAYFSTVDELSLGPVAKIISQFNIFEQLSSKTLLTIWVNATCNRFCCKGYTYYLQPSDRLSDIKGPYEGRHLSFVGTLLSNMTNGKNAIRIVRKGCSEVICETLVMKNIPFVESSTFVDEMTLPMMEIEDAKVFRANNELFLVVFTSNDSTTLKSAIRVYQYKDGWEERQMLSTFSAKSIDLLNGLKETDIYLAVAYQVLVQNCKNQSLIYKWDTYKREFLPFHPMLSCCANVVLWISRRGEHYLIVGYKNSQQNLKGYSFPMSLYVLDKGKFYILQTVHSYHVVSVDFISLRGEDYVLVADSLYDLLRVLQWRGYNLFEEIQTIKVNGVSHVAHYFWNDRLFIVVASSNKILLMEAMIRGSDMKFS
ncbi:uncharacterized protein [Centruroides vittatus]|uniref:uncharacterized protein n=1 Tax=Centruroides vittatus TaxID=120091 RepID=UPI00350F000B